MYTTKAKKANKSTPKTIVLGFISTTLYLTKAPCIKSLATPSQYLSLKSSISILKIYWRYIEKSCFMKVPQCYKSDSRFSTCMNVFLQLIFSLQEQTYWKTRVPLLILSEVVCFQQTSCIIWMYPKLKQSGHSTTLIATLDASTILCAFL